ncbi:MAG: helix-hairpin-helix domain-containing protein [Gammaproteobacteria bacterium]|nr:helix-hairpin-helix domain-containing protein [Gammaproteobacteria bacterium]MCW5584222.1 helix-hairpin-helix domain-containing protein [Gammaproteobacteria bacterium]
MFFHRTFLAAVVAMTITGPVLAGDIVNPQGIARTLVPVAARSNNMQAAASAEPISAVETKVNINKASAKDLLKVKGMNVSKARAIISYRKKHGDFKSLDDLVHVKGMARVKAEEMKAIQDQLTLS